jgi:localization factor PodJL
VADLQRQIEQVSMEAAEGVQQRITAEMDDLRRRIDQVASRGTDRAVIDGLTKQLDEMRQFVERIAEPQRIERLAEEVGTLGRLMAEMRLNQIGRNDFANLKSALEDIRTALKRSEDEKAASAIPEQLRSLSQRVDQLVNRPQPAGAEPVRDQMTALADKLSRLAADRTRQADAVTGFMERISGQVAAVSDRLAAPPEAVMERLDRIEDGLRQVGRDSDTAQIELMLRSVQERLERAPMSAGSLEGLERQIEALTGRLTDFGDGEPLRQVVTETLAQVKSLRDQAGEIAERAVKAALREVRGAGAPQSAADLEAVKQGFAELKALQASADRKTQQTLKAVHNALETLVLRAPAPLQNVTWAGPAREGAGEGGEPPAAIRLEAAVRRLHAAAISHVEEVTSSAGTDEPRNEQSETEEVLIEPGTPRLAPSQPATSFTAAPDAEPAHVRANFIAAARRAVLAAQGDRRAATGDEPATFGPVEEPETGERAISNQTLIERIRQTFDAHRRPLLLSLALLILAAGTAQIVGTTSQEDALATPTASVEKTTPETKPKPVSTAAGSSDAGKAAETAEAAPDVTGSLLQPKALAAPATGGVSAFSRRVADVAADDLPSALSPSLRDAALIGDPAAVFEVAARLAEGRDVKQDPALAAHLFEKVAETGLAPAQYRIGNIYEKGFGVPRDPVAAKGWYERAAETGNARAMHNLGVLLAEGVGGKPDYAAAQRWFLSAAEHGVKDSQYNLGVLLARGLGVGQDLGQSYKWFALAANQGDQEAAKKRDEVALRLAPADLAAAKASVAGWQAKAGDAAANEVPPPPQGWSSLSGASKRS